MKKPCCSIPDNLARKTLANDRAIDVCLECGAKHYRMKVDPVRFGVTGSDLGEAPTPDLELRITMDDAGKISVFGPLDNKAIAYAMLEAAKDVIREYHQAAALTASVQRETVQ